jgi:hypothetical protein
MLAGGTVLLDGPVLSRRTVWPCGHRLARRRLRTRRSRVRGFLRPFVPVLRAGRRFVRVERHQWGRLIRWEFLPDFACGFRSIRTASGASSHAAINPCRKPLLTPEYHTRRGCGKSCALRHIQFQSGNTILTVGNRVRKAAALSFFHRARNDTIKGLVESDLRPTLDAARHEF